jgi:hypothetical protein
MTSRTEELGGPMSVGARYGSVPVPDPTTLTATAVRQAKEDLRREMDSMQALLEARIGRNEIGLSEAANDRKVEVASAINQLEALLVQRINGLEKIMQLLDKALNRAPREADELRQRLQTDIQIAVDGLRLLHEERFNAIQQQFNERDTRGDQEKKASKEALDAALLAQKESVAQQNDANTTAATKSETSFTKQIDQIGTLIATLEKSLTDRITELKERIDRGEGQGQGRDNALGNPYESAVLEQAREAARAALAQSQDAVAQVAAQARAAQSRAVIALGISGVLVLITLVSVIFAITKK